MIEIYAFQSPIPYIHLILCLLAALRLRRYSRIDYLTVFPWIMLIVYGHPIFGGTVFLVVFSAILLRTRKAKPANWERITKLFVIVGLDCVVWLWVNQNAIHMGYGYPIWYGIATSAIGVVLMMSHTFLIWYASNEYQESVPSIYKYVATCILEVLISLVLWTLMVTTMWNVLADSWFYIVLPLAVFGITAPLLTYKLHQFRLSRRYPPGLWRYSPSIVTFLWGALVVLVPIIGPMVCLLLYSRLTRPQPKFREASVQKMDRAEV